MNFEILKKCLISILFLFISCSVDFSLLENRQCDNQGRCLPGYVCDRNTMTCVKQGQYPGGDSGILTDAATDIIVHHDAEGTDVTCTPTNNGVEICDGLDNNCNGLTDENYVCQGCTPVDSINKECNENTFCNVCFFVGGEKYICVSENGGEFKWTRERDISCKPERKGFAVRCESRCIICDGEKNLEPFSVSTESCDGKDNNCNGTVDEGDLCKAGEICVDGECISKPCSTNADCPQDKICKDNRCSNCQDVVDDSLCGPGKICFNGSCIEGDCHQDSDCSPGICISNKCCADCCRKKEDCPSEKICKNNKCTQCNDKEEDSYCGKGYICVDNKCIQGECHPDSILTNCTFQWKICVNYYCCTPGPTCCNEDKHCKANMYCSTSHTCECKTGFGDCNNRFDDGCEKDLSNDLNNCGACNQICTRPNATSECVNMECVIKSCNPGYKDCNGKAEDGCEVDITSDILNCGDCQIECKADNAKVKCEQSKCVISSCEQNFADCDQDFNNGCEVDIKSDDNNCGSCGNKCKAGKHCDNGQCK